MVRDYVKINEQDLKLAEEFFENDKHFNEWLINVFRYYRGKNVEIKTKIVQKYFNNYKKTMDYILKSVKTGSKGAEVKAEKQALKEATLEGVVEGVVKPSLEPNIEIVIENKEVISSKPKTIEQRKADFLILVNETLPAENKERLKSFIDYWSEYSPNAKKMRWEKQDAFDISRRMGTWKKNEKPNEYPIQSSTPKSLYKTQAEIIAENQ